MSNDLTVPEKGTLVAGNITDDLFNQITAGNDFFPRIQLMGGNSGLVQEGKATVGNYCFIRTKEDFADLGAEIDVLVCAMRLKAMRIADEVISVFDPEDPEFSKIWAESKIKDSGCLAGPEFLLWLPEKKEFVTFFMASKTASKVAPTVRTYIADGSPRPCTLKATLITTKKYKWHGPVITDCSTPFPPPEQEAFIDALDKFQNPPENEVESVDDTDTRDR